MKIKYKLRNKIISIFAIIITVINISGISNASLVGRELVVSAGWYGGIPYAYNGEERKALTRSCENYPVYIMQKNNDNTYFTTSELTKYKNEKIKNVLKNGYGCKTYEEIGCLNTVEAFLATQEAVYIVLEGRSIEDYEIFEPQGERILNATKKILADAANEKKDIIEISTEDKYWKEYEADSNYKYKEYTINSTATQEGKFELTEGENSKIIDKFTKETKQEFLDGDSFYLVVPKNKEQDIKIKMTYKKQGLVMYTCKQAETLQETYIFSEPGLEELECYASVNVAGNSKVEILNQDKETKTPIAGNVFSILKEDNSALKENLTTNEAGKINTTLDKGKYYLKQTSSVDGYSINKALIEINIEDKENVKMKIESTKPTTEETTTIDKEINVTEENKNVIENNVTEVTDINTTNINKEIINQTNKTRVE